MLCKIVAYIVLQLFMVHCSTDILVTRTCERINIEHCKNIGYNFTGMPFRGHYSQLDAAIMLEGFSPLVQYGCSSRLQFFLCSAYLPMCSEKVPQLIGPCRPFCEDVQGLCEPVLAEFGFPWPKSLNCSQFPPENNVEHMCMDGPDYEERRTYPFRKSDGFRSDIERGSGVHHRIPSVQAILQCKHLHSAALYYYVNHTGRCVATCDGDILYTKENKDFAQMWMAVCSSSCFLSCLFTIIAFFINSSNYRLSYRIIFILSMCYFMSSIGFFIRLLGGRNNTACYWDTHYREPLLVQSGFNNINCTIVFSLLYFSQMASNVWWVILSFTWFLTTGLRWSVESVENFGTFFHVIAWLVPALKTIAILMLRAVDADELTGTCYVGNQNPDFQLGFVIVPFVVYFILGVSFLLIGMIASFKNEKLRSSKTSSKEKWELLKGDIAVFAILYMVPASCILVANVYEYSLKEQWLAFPSDIKPNVQVFTLKIFMSLVVGFIIGVGLWISQTSFSTKFCCRSKDLTTGASENRTMLLEGQKNHQATLV